MAGLISLVQGGDQPGGHHWGLQSPEWRLNKYHWLAILSDKVDFQVNFAIRELSAACFVCFPLTFSGVIICSQCFRSSYKEVHVRLGDKNDHSPVFDKEEYHVTVSEAALVNTPITKLKVSAKCQSALMKTLARSLSCDSSSQPSQASATTIILRATC